ncbi:MAG: hypothetical protein ABI972_17770 [Acidobacteriota bacterium]
MRRTIFISITLFVFAGGMFAQQEEESKTAFVRRFSIGGRLSFPVLRQVSSGETQQSLTTGPTEITATSEGKSVIAGGGVALQFAVRDRYAVSVDLMRRKVGYHLTTVTFVGTDNTATVADERKGTTLSEQTRASSWELPILVRRYSIGRFEEGPRWFVEGGPSIRRTGGVSTFTQVNDDCCLQIPAKLSSRYTPGITIGMGGQLADDYGVKIVPEIRYTRWLGRPFDSAPARSQVNQLEVLIGVTF